MLLLFFLVWIVFNGRITLEIALFGVGVSALMFWFLCRFMDYSLSKERALLKKLPVLGRFFVCLIKEIISANLTVCRMILSRKEQVEPVLVRLSTDLKTETARVMLANSITLTPGTISVSLTEGELLVHCLDKSLAGSMENSRLEQLLRELEKEEA